MRLTLENVSRRPMSKYYRTRQLGEEWQLRAEESQSRPLFVDIPESHSEALVVGPSVDIYIATLAWGSSLQLSCHDNGWIGFPQNKNPVQPLSWQLS